MAKQVGGTNLGADKKRVAKPAGARFKGNNYDKPTEKQIKKGLEKGTVYIENRANRSDKKPNVNAGKGRNVSYGSGGLLGLL